MNELFFELIRLSIGTQSSLSHQPTGKEWKRLYDMALKQSLVGICFAGVRKLCDSDAEYYHGMTEMQYLVWMGMAAKIQQRNQVVDEQCVKLQRQLAEDGFRSCILKGQGVVPYYGEQLSHLRQSGDIDAWIEGEREKIIGYVNRACPTDDISYLHTRFAMFDDTVVELHFTPSVCSGKKRNEMMQKWFESQKESCFTNRIVLEGGLEVAAPTVEFNMVYLLHHIYRHYLYEGIGLRQVMDYYFVLCAYHAKCDRLEVKDVLKNLGLTKFAGAVMYIMHEIFHLDDKSMICPVDEKRGRRLLEVIMEGGNFGHSTEKYKITGWEKPWFRLSRYVRRNWFMLMDYPEEILSNVQLKFRVR